MTQEFFNCIMSTGFGIVCLLTIVGFLLYGIGSVITWIVKLVKRPKSRKVELTNVQKALKKEQRMDDIKLGAQMLAVLVGGIVIVIAVIFGVGYGAYALGWAGSCSSL